MALDPITAITSLANTVIERIFPDKTEQEKAKLELAKMQLSGELQQASQDVQLQLAQIEVNKADAASQSWWQSGWRPAVGWVGAFGFGYSVILEPLARFIATVGFGYHGAFPVLDSTLTMQVLFGLLGFGAFRSFDKLKGKA